MALFRLVNGNVQTIQVPDTGHKIRLQSGSPVLVEDPLDIEYLRSARNVKELKVKPVRSVKPSVDVRMDTPPPEVITSSPEEDKKPWFSKKNKTAADLNEDLK